jgi:hypothetical protein
MVAANPHGAGAWKELPRLLFPLPRGLTSSGTSRLLPILCLVLRKTGGNARNKLLIWLEMFLVGERQQQGDGESWGSVGKPRCFRVAWRFKFVSRDEETCGLEVVNYTTKPFSGQHVFNILRCGKPAPNRLIHHFLSPQILTVLKPGSAGE